jgi:aromatic-L-amino-acid decarboxylase
MHEINPTSERMVSSVLAYAENRLKLNPVPLDKARLSPTDLYERLQGMIRESPRPSDEVL